MKIKVNLTRKEYDYLVNNLLKGNKEILSDLEFSDDNENSINIYLKENAADDIRELAEDKTDMNCYNENGFPTEEGRILERFINKFYF